MESIVALVGMMAWPVAITVSVYIICKTIIKGMKIDMGADDETDRHE